MHERPEMFGMQKENRHVRFSSKDYPEAKGLTVGDKLGFYVSGTISDVSKGRDYEDGEEKKTGDVVYRLEINKFSKKENISRRIK